MGSEFFRHPAKRLDKEFRRIGARRARQSSHAVLYTFADGAQRLVPRNIGPGTARLMLNEVQQLYKVGLSPLGRTEKRSGAPTIDFNNLCASAHALERFRLMQKQADLTHTEMMLAIRAPERVLWSPDHGSWLWVGDRIAVAITVTDNGAAVIRTLLWTTRELWDSNPRPGAVRE